MTTLHRSSSPAPSATSTLRSVLSQAELASTSAKRPLEEPSDETLRVEERAQVAELPRDGACQEDAVTLPKSGGRVKRGLKAVWDLLRAQWFVLGVGVVIVLAWAFPNVARPGGAIRSEYTIKYLAVAIIFFISGLTLPLRNLFLRAGDWKLHLVCHITSFFLFPAVTFAIINAVRAADPQYKRFDRWALVGMQVMAVLPTTVSSNVVMTGQAGGDEAATTVEVMIGNLFGTFLSPALLSLFMSSSTWSFGKPVASGKGGIGELYRQVIQQLGFTVFVPLTIGEILQYIWPKQVKWTRTTFRLGKVGSICLLLVIWSTFSGAFYEGAFEILTGEAVAFVVLVNIGLYLVISLFLFLVCRLIPSPRLRLEGRKFAYDGSGPLFDAATTIAALFVGGAKGAALGAPIVSILYGGLDGQARGIVSLPLVLYQGSQVVLGQLAVVILKWWKGRIDRHEAGEDRGTA